MQIQSEKPFIVSLADPAWRDRPNHPDDITKWGRYGKDRKAEDLNPIPGQRFRLYHYSDLTQPQVKSCRRYASDDDKYLEAFRIGCIGYTAPDGSSEGPADLDVGWTPEELAEHVSYTDQLDIGKVLITWGMYLGKGSRPRCLLLPTSLSSLDEMREIRRSAEPSPPAAQGPSS